MRVVVHAQWKTCLLTRAGKEPGKLELRDCLSSAGFQVVLSAIGRFAPARYVPSPKKERSVTVTAILLSRRLYLRNADSTECMKASGDEKSARTVCFCFPSVLRRKSFSTALNNIERSC